ncbi:HD domain-containing protein [Natronincola peptidivorans]|uniref:HD domain-containing protein n=1 Tax=Natronincola peptidivorans TaxID=426128 RepID=A0A1I0EWC2_9FIRM|nr:HD domain-containing phosphohydrolase [Natronincola peptidivorans]SET49914.1 HD domain-containing protein [Natronincola peptidivorans]
MTGKTVEVSLLDLSLMLSDAIDLINPTLNNHHKQVAYIAYHIGKEMNLSPDKQNQIIIASLLHDIGALTLKDRVASLQFEIEDSNHHAYIGYLLLKNYKKFNEAAEIIRYHHQPWQDGKGEVIDGVAIPIESHIIHLADRIAVLIKKDFEILSQAKEIVKHIESRYIHMFHPKILKAFKIVMKKESFWFDLIFSSIDDKIKKLSGSKNQFLGLEELMETTKIFAYIIDFRSRFTSVHSSGVAAVAEALAKIQHWSWEDCLKIKIAGYLHDIGKLGIPSEILEKPDKLTKEEYSIMKIHPYYSYHLLDKIRAFDNDIKQYAALHHERIDGTGYPFRIQGEALKEGSKIIAVADVFTAITEERPYRKGMKEIEALKVLNKMVNRNVIDPHLVKVLSDNFAKINITRIQAQEKAMIEYNSFRKTARVRSKKYA